MNKSIHITAVVLMSVVACGQRVVGGDDPDGSVVQPPDAADLADRDAATTTNLVPSLCTSHGWCWMNPAPLGHDLQSVWGTNANDVWLAGSGTTIRIEDDQWRYALEDRHVSAVWGSSADDIWAVATSIRNQNEPAMYHWDGTSWTTAFNQSAIEGSGSLRVVTGSGPDNVWTFGFGALRRWDGRVRAPGRVAD